MVYVVNCFSCFMDSRYPLCSAMDLLNLLKIILLCVKLFFLVFLMFWK